MKIACDLEGSENYGGCFAVLVDDESQVEQVRRAYKEVFHSLDWADGEIQGALETMLVKLGFGVLVECRVIDPGKS